MYKQYRSVNKGDFKNYFSVYEGCGGFIYLSYNYSKLFSDEGIRNKFYYVLNDVLNYYNENEFDKDLDKDFINGFGSTVLLLSRLYLETGIKVSYKERIKLLLENYYDFLRKSDFIEIGLAVFCKTFLHNIAKKKYTPLRLKFFSDYFGLDRAFLSRKLSPVKLKMCA